MSVLCVIPSRMASKRLPGKPLIDLNGQSLIERVCRAVKNAACFDDIIVATDDQSIFDHVASLGFSVEMTSADHESGTDRCNEVARRHPEYDYIVNVQGDEPFIESDLLQGICERLESGDHNGIVTAVSSASPEDHENKNRVKAVLNINDDVLYFSRALIPFPRDISPSHPIWRHLGIYGFRSSLLDQLCTLPQAPLEKIEGLEQLRWLYHGFKIRVLKGNWSGFGIDSPEDVAAFRNRS